MRDTAGGKPIAVLLQSISGVTVTVINPLVAFYVIHGGKREVLFFYFVPDTTRDTPQGRGAIILLSQPAIYYLVVGNTENVTGGKLISWSHPMACVSFSRLFKRLIEEPERLYSKLFVV
jgi:hypothetical protein